MQHFIVLCSAENCDLEPGSGSLVMKGKALVFTYNEISDEASIKARQKIQEMSALRGKSLTPSLHCSLTAFCQVQLVMLGMPAE